MKNLLVIFLLSISLSLFGKDSSNVIILYPTNEEGEPFVEACFVAGYESTGRVYKGHIEKFDSVSSLYAPYTAEPHKATYNYIAKWGLENDHKLILAPIQQNSAYQSDSGDYYHARGIQFVAGGGSNAYHTTSYGGQPWYVIPVGAGDDTANLTSRKVEFVTDHPYSSFPIVSITQGSGDSLVITLNTATDTTGGFGVGTGYAVVLQGITGFSNNPEGVKINIKSSIGVWNRIVISHNAGTGSYTSGGIAKMYYQSYAVPYLAGILCALKDSLNCSFWEARYRLRMTASMQGSISYWSGYGKPNFSAAVNFSGVIPPDEFNTIGEIKTLTATQRFSQDLVRIRLGITPVTNALYYRLYDGTELLYEGTSIDLTIQLKRTRRDLPHRLWYQAFRLDTQESDESNKVTINYPYYSKIRYRN